jgi:hypothetical protein
MAAKPTAEKFMAIAKKNLPLYELPRLKTLIEDHLNQIGFYDTIEDNTNKDGAE